MAKFEHYYSVRIIAIEDIPYHNVKKGDVGGSVFLDFEKSYYIEDTYSGNSWVAEPALSKESILSDNAVIRGNSFVSSSILKDNVIVDGAEYGDFKTSVVDCELSGDVYVGECCNIENMKISGDAKISFISASYVKLEELSLLSHKLCTKREIDAIYENKYQIIATIDIPSQNVKKGDLGGNIATLSHLTDGEVRFSINDNAWVSEMAYVDEHSSLYDEARASGYAVLESSTLRGSSEAKGLAFLVNVQLHDNALIDTGREIVRIENISLNRDYVYDTNLTAPENQLSCMIQDILFTKEEKRESIGEV